MSQGLHLSRLAIATMVAASLAGCSSENNYQAPITAIGAGGGAPASSTKIAQPQPVISPQNASVAQTQNSNVPAMPSSMSSAAQDPDSANMKMQPSQSIKSSPATPPHTAVVTENGKIVYNRNYGNIPKGSYNGGTYTVQHGDTLFYIAWISGNDFRDLAQRNHLTAPYSLSAGQVLQIGNSVGEPITGANEITKADSAAAQRINSNSDINYGSNEYHAAMVAKQSVITYSNGSDSTNSSSSADSGSQLLPKRSGVMGSASAPITAPTVSSTTNTAPINSWRWPTQGKIIDNFSAAEGGNKGIDIAGSQGQSVVATAAGRVVYAGNALRGYGNLIIIKHSDDYLSAYAHNDTMLVREQQEVTSGQKIATMGSTGSSSVRLHFEIRYKGKSVNPLRYLSQR